MRTKKHWLCLAGLLSFLCVPASATVTITAVTPSAAPPKAIGTVITWTVTATDTNPGPLMFQFNVGAPLPSGGNAPMAMAKDFNVGTLSTGVWTAQPWVWSPTGIEGSYQIQVIAKDFTSGESTTFNGKFQVNPLVTTTALVVPTANPLVALFSAPSCSSGTSMRVSFLPQGSTGAPTTTGSLKCHPPASMTFEVAGMYASTAYNMVAQTRVGTGPWTNSGSTLTFTTGALPTTITFPTFTPLVKAGSKTDRTDKMLLVSPHSFGGGTIFPDVATDLNGKIMWYYLASPPQDIVLARPLTGGTMLTIQSGPSWTGVSDKQLLRQIDVAGNIIRETNAGIIQHQLVAMGYTDGGPCNIFSSPAAIGSACLDDFHHDFIVLPNNTYAVLADIEKIFPVGTQGDTSGLPVDVVGDAIVYLNSNWQVIGFWDAFQHDGGAPQLDINRAAVLGETCITGQQGCPPMGLLGPGISKFATDWLHANSLYYWPQNGDIILSVRSQDWIVKIDYNKGTGTGNILWRMGNGGDFTFDNLFSDPWPWFSGQHDVGIENGGTGPMTMFDNGNTRISPPPVGLGSGNSRCMSLTFSESTMTVTPVLAADLGSFSNSGGNAQLLSDGNYYCYSATVLISLNNYSFSTEILPTAGTDTGTKVLSIQGPEGYRGWQLPSLYSPPTT